MPRLTIYDVRDAIEALERATTEEVRAHVHRASPEGDAPSQKAVRVLLHALGSNAEKGFFRRGGGVVHEGRTWVWVPVCDWCLAGCYQIEDEVCPQCSGRGLCPPERAITPTRRR